MEAKSLKGTIFHVSTCHHGLLVQWIRCGVHQSGIAVHSTNNPRLKAFFFDRNEQDNNDARNNDNFGFKSRKCPPQNSELDNFEADLLDMVHNIKFRNVYNKFQNKLNEGISKIKKSTKAFIPADKTSNFYKLDKTQHDKLLRDSITTTYKKASTDAANVIDSEAKSIAQKLNIDNRTEQIAKQQAFITLKDHKDNFVNHPTCRLINPAKSELGKVSKQILDNINSKIRKATKLNQWKNTSDVTNWFTSIPDMQKHSFASFDIDSFYPSITEPLLSKAISFCQELYHNQRQRHGHNHALPEITLIRQRNRLDQEKPQQHVRRNYGQLRRSGSL